MGRGQEDILGVTAGHSAGAPDEDTPQIPIPEGESDDEYEMIPSRKEKESRDLRKGSQNERIPHAAPIIKGEVASQGGADAEESKEPGRAPIVGDAEEAVDGDQEESAAVNDDDWLRSRTNRLLDLMDPDDVLLHRKNDTAQPPPTDSGAAPDIPEGDKSADDAAEPVAQDHTVAETSSTPDTLDVIRRTSRLFVRNLPYGATEDDIREEFGQFGAIEEVRDSFRCCNTCPPTFGRFRLCDETQIGTAYTTVYDAILAKILVDASII